MIKTLKIAWKDLKLLVRDWYGLFWLFVFPLLFAVVFGTIFASSQRGQYSFEVMVLADADEPSPRVAWVIEKLRELDDLSIVVGHSREEARSAVRSNRITAYLELIETETERSIFPSHRFQIGIEGSRKAELSYLKGRLTEILLRKTKQPDSNSTESAPALFQVNDLSDDTQDASPSSPFSVSFPQAILWGLLACAAGFATSLVSERTGGTFLRLRMAPIHPLQLLAGKATACFLTCAAVILVLTTVGVLFFDVVISNGTVFAVALVSSSFCIVGLMMFISTLGQTERAVGGSGWAIMAVMAMFGGGMVPLFTMPAWMKAVSDFSPVKWSIYAIEGALWRQIPISEIMTPALVLIGCGGLFFLAGLINFYRMMKR